jgi:predicted nuclease of restriction endonuclease-like (RecB) superfamily
MDNRFTDIITLIKQTRTNAIKAVNAELINLYWNIGEYISKKIEHSEWGDSVVAELANFIKTQEPEIKGFSDKNIWRMKQFYETYRDFPKLSTLLREISWSHNLAIFSRCKTVEEREFYLKLAKQDNYSFRELDRQISASLFERTMIGNTKLSSALRESNQDLSNTFKDSYVFEFLNLPEPHGESELQLGLVRQMKNFILELGKDFLFIGEEYNLQVGNNATFSLTCYSTTVDFNV